MEVKNKWWDWRKKFGLSHDIPPDDIVTLHYLLKMENKTILVRGQSELDRCLFPKVVRVSPRDFAE